nr:CRISPR-associated protein Csx16 [uncultured Undibacterium sp.]
MLNGLIFTRHLGAATWIRKTVGVLDMPVLHGLDELQFNGIIADSDRPITDVFGVIPLKWHVRLQSCAIRVWSLEMDVPPDLRGKEISTDAMYELNARLVRYDVRWRDAWPSQQYIHALESGK